MRHFFLFVIASFSFSTFAVRPFITDDARVVGWRLAQWETWTRFDKHEGQWWHMLAYGPTPWLEVTAGFVKGYERGINDTRFSFALPLVQAKFLFKPYEPGKGPGFGLVTGTFLPGGRGAFVPAGYGAFGFFTVSQCFGEGEKVLIHANLGGNYLFSGGNHEFLATWGFGSQVKTYKGFHLVGEMFSGDPYIPGTGTAFQFGFRHFISDLVQIDATVGKGVAGQVVMPVWVSAGARFVTERFNKTKHAKI
jgi:hypothetical protein